MVFLNTIWSNCYGKFGNMYYEYCNLHILRIDISLVSVYSQVTRKLVSFSTKTHAHTYKYNTHLHTITCLASTTFSLDLKLVYQISFAKYVSYSISSGLGGPEEDHQLHHCCWTGRVSEREEEVFQVSYLPVSCIRITKITHSSPAMFFYLIINTFI